MPVSHKPSTLFSRAFIWIPLLSFTLVTLLIGAVGYTIFAQYKRSIEQQEIIDLGAIADLKVAQISAWRNSQVRGAESFMRGAIIPEIFERWLREGAKLNKDRQKILNALAGMRQTQGYQDTLVFDRQGMSRIATKEGYKPDAEEIQLALEAMRDRKILFRDIHWHGGNLDKRLEFHYFAPLMVTDEKGSRVVGAIMLVVAPDLYLFPMIQSWPTSSPSAETLLVRRDGDDVLFLNTLRHKKVAPLSLRIPIATPNLPPAIWFRGGRELGRGIDYRGVPVVSVIREIPATPWIMVAKIDRDELLAPVNALQRWVLFLSLLFIADAGFLILAWRREYHARKQSLRTKQEYKAIIQTARDGFLVVDARGGRLLDVNEAYSRMTGYSTEELLNMRIADIEAMESPEQVDRHNKNIQDAGGDLFETRHRCKDGRIIDVEVSVQCLDLHGGVSIAFIRDITERKATEQKILRLNRLYLGLSRANEAIAHIHDRNALLQEICHIAVEYGRFRLAWIGLINHETQDVEIVASSGEALAYLENLDILSVDADKPGGCGPTGASIREHKIYICNDFSSHPLTLPWRERARNHGLYASATCPLIHEGRAIGAFVLYAGEKNYFDQEMTTLLTDLSTDIFLALENIAREEKRAQAEQVILEGRKFLHQVIDADPNCIFVKDADGRLLLANLAFATKVGKISQELVGIKTATLLPNREQYELNLEMDRKAIETRRKVQYIIPLEMDGDERWMQIIKVPMEQRDGTVHILGIMMDITDSKLAEEELTEAYRELEKVTTHLEVVREEEQKRIARELHDEMGSVLAALHINVSLLAQEIPAEMEHLQTYADALAKLVASGIQAMRNTVASLRPCLLEEVGLKLALEQCVQNFRLNAGIECELRLPEEEITLDETRSTAIFRIVQESLSNVAKYAGASKVNITLSDWDESLVLTVKDNGKGFDPTIRKAKSFGLIGIRERAALVGGVADISSAPGKGTVVQVNFPL